jgi:inorganic pyrophosphatase
MASRKKGAGKTAKRSASRRRPARLSPRLALDALDPIDPDSGDVNVVIETTRGSRNKLKYDESLGLFTLAHVLPEGAVFPYDFGFVPGTKAGDGDPVDVLVLMGDSAPTASLVRVRLVGSILAEQQKDGERPQRNDRLIGVASEDHTYDDTHELSDLSDAIVRQVEHFFVSYNEARGTRFTVVGRGDAAAARREVMKARGG